MPTLTTADLLTTGTAPATAMGMTYLTLAQSIGMVMGNAVTAQQGTQRVAEASTAVIMALAFAKGAGQSGS